MLTRILGDIYTRAYIQRIPPQLVCAAREGSEEEEACVVGRCAVCAKNHRSATQCRVLRKHTTPKSTGQEQWHAEPKQGRLDQDRVEDAGRVYSSDEGHTADSCSKNLMKLHDDMTAGPSSQIGSNVVSNIRSNNALRVSEEAVPRYADGSYHHLSGQQASLMSKCAYKNLLTGQQVHIH